MMRRLCLSICCAAIWLVYWPVFWFAKLSQIGKLRGLQYRVTMPLAEWVYANFGERE